MDLGEGKVVAEVGNLVVHDGLADDGSVGGAGGALQVFELIDERPWHLAGGLRVEMFLKGKPAFSWGAFVCAWVETAAKSNRLAATRHFIGADTSCAVWTRARPEWNYCTANFRVAGGRPSNQIQTHGDRNTSDG